MIIIPPNHIHIIRHGSHAVLTFIREELLYDIKNYCFIEGDIKEGDEHQKHQVFDVCEDGNIDRVTRVLDLTFEQCVDMCYPYTKREVCNMARRDDELEEEDEYVMRMNLPQWFSDTTVSLLEKLIHELLVYRVMEDWLSITHPEAATKWKEKAENAEKEISSALTRRARCLRRKLNPF